MRGNQPDTSDRVEAAAEPAYNWMADLMGCYDVMQWEMAEECAESVILLEDAGAEALMRYYNH